MDPDTIPDTPDRATRQADLATVIASHRLDTMSQDSGQHCICHSDSRVEQPDNDGPWSTIHDHIAGRVMQHLDPVADPTPIQCESRFISERLIDPDQDQRMRCAVVGVSGAAPARHEHCNADGSLRWANGAEVSVRDIVTKGEG